jgi:hypothetical protein
MIKTTEFIPDESTRRNDECFRDMLARKCADMTNNDMTPRDYFAAKALAALITEPKWHDGQNGLILTVLQDGGFSEAPRDTASMYAKAAYLLADAMIEERKK